jgi:predicted ferric reductase
MQSLLMRSPVAVAAFWIGTYLAITLLPLLVLLFYLPPEGRTFWIEFSVALGFIGLAMMALHTKLRSNVVDLQECMILEKSSKTKPSWRVR